ncbi:MAG: hypothetical protein R8K20_03840, partial [Gallionellaceae bacterium]
MLSLITVLVALLGWLPLNFTSRFLWWQLNGHFYPRLIPQFSRSVLNGCYRYTKELKGFKMALVITPLARNQTAIFASGSGGSRTLSNLT